MVSLFCTIHAHLTVLVEEKTLSSFLLLKTVKCISVQMYYALVNCIFLVLRRTPV